MKFLGFNSPFHNFMGRIFDLVLLHLLWVICSLPVITIGASTSALFTVTLKMVKNEEAYIVNSFWSAFKANFKQSTRLWGISAAIFVWLLLIMRICMKGNAQALKLLGIPNAALLIMTVLALVYVFPIQAKYENTVGNIPYSILLVSVIFIPIVLTGYVESLFPIMIALWIFCGSSLIAFGSSFILNRVFDSIAAAENCQSDKQ